MLQIVHNEDRAKAVPEGRIHPQEQSAGPEATRGFSAGGGMVFLLVKKLPLWHFL